MTKIKMSKQVKEKLEAERQEKNKVRIFDLMTRISLMDIANVPGVQSPTFCGALTKNILDERDPTALKPGFSIRLLCYADREATTGKYHDCIYRIDSEEWEFEVLEDYLEQLQWRADEEKRKQEERNAELRMLSPKQREVLGFAYWRDPQAS